MRVAADGHTPGSQHNEESPMKTWWIAVLMTTMLALGVAPDHADAKRLGGGKSSGMQRATPTQPAQTPPATPAAAPATPGATGAAPAAVPPKRSWMGPLAGLAAGLGLAALFSHFGMGEGLANVVMIALLAAAAFVVIRLLMRRFGPAAPNPQFAAAGPGANVSPLMRHEPPMAAPAAVPSGVVIGSALAAPVLPAGFDAPAFERTAKMIFIRLQAANDSADLNDLRQFTTPELFASLRLDLQDRGGVAQTTDVEQVDAKVLDFVQEPDRQIVSVHFQGRVREETGAAAVAFDEVWHLVKPTDGSREWAIAGIQQRQ
jgi:predicted lipid-binding transport protein (Tim44 family)